MGGITFSGNAGGRSVFQIAPTFQQIGSFGGPFVPVLQITIPENRANTVVLRGQLWFFLNAGGMDLALSSNGFFNGSISVDSVGGGNNINTSQIPTTFFYPGAAFNDLTVFNFYYASVNPQPGGDIDFIFNVRENSADTPGFMLQGSYIEQIYF